MSRSAANLSIVALAALLAWAPAAPAQSARLSHTASLARTTSSASPAQASASTPGAGADASLAALDTEALGWLQALVRIDTTNPPGNELQAAKYIADVFQKEGIHSEIFESAPGRGFLVARLSSSAVADPSRALLLMAHLDVVGVDKSKWTVDPFGAVIQGRLYVRPRRD